MIFRSPESTSWRIFYDTLICKAWWFSIFCESGFAMSLSFGSEVLYNIHDFFPAPNKPHCLRVLRLIFEILSSFILEGFSIIPGGHKTLILLKKPSRLNRFGSHVCKLRVLAVCTVQNILRIGSIGSQ